MSQAGVECVTAFPWGLPFISILFQRLDLRNHRKILVIDNAVAFTGSRNCADMAFAIKARFAPWVDILVRVEGPAVRQLQGVFLSDWMSYTAAIWAPCCSRWRRSPIPASRRRWWPPAPTCARAACRTACPRCCMRRATGGDHHAVLCPR